MFEETLAGFVAGAALSGTIAWWSASRRSHRAIEALRGRAESALTERESEYEARAERLERERSRERQRATLPLARALLPAIDDLERAHAMAGGERAPSAEEWRDGLGAVRRRIEAALAAHQFDALRPKRGDPYDARRHEAVEMIEDGGGGGALQIESCLRAGWEHESGVVRPAMVRVARGASPVGEAREAEQE